VPEGYANVKRVACNGDNGDDVMDWDMLALEKDDATNGSDCFSFESINDDFDDMEVASSFDIKVLQNSVAASADALELVNGKDVVLVVGKTGVGKSTLIQGIAGKKIQTSVYEATFTGNTASRQVYDVATDDAMAGFEIGHDAKSMTSHLNAFVRKNDLGEETVYLDSPGMEDTNGVEMDIATSALFSQVAKRCKSLKFVVVVHCASLLEDRGGAFRSVLKFARRFVSDFKKSKLSFMFLFSHSNEIANMSDSIENAKERLRDEIILTAKGTADKDVLMVLQFIRQSLEKKDYPFAGIYRPLEMDFALLAFQVEKKLKKMTELTLASSCNLTTASTLKLDGAVQALVQRLRVSLRASSPDPDTVKEISNTLHCLTTYVEVDCVRKASEESKSVMDEHIDATKSFIEGHVIRGLHSDTQFSSENARLIKASLMLLKELDSSFSVDQWFAKTKKRLINFKTDILRELLSSTSSFHVDAKKMSVWSEEFDEFSDLYRQTCQSLVQKIQDMASKMSETDVSSMDQGSKDEITHFVTCYSQFYQFCERAVHFPLDGIDVQHFLSVRDTVTQSIVDLLESWASNTAKLVPVNLEKMISGNLSLQLIASRVKAIEIMEDVLTKQSTVCSVLVNKAKASRKQVEGHVVGWFISSCTSLKEKGVHSQLEASLVWMRDTCLLFAEMQGARWKSLQPAYSSLVEKARAWIGGIAQDLVSRCKIIQQNGMADGKQLARDLQHLHSFKWLDSFTNPTFGGVVNSCAEAESFIKARIREKEKKLDKLTSILEPNSPQSCSTIDSMGDLLLELREIDAFESASTLSTRKNSLSRICIAKLEVFATKLNASGSKYLEYWVNGLSQGPRLGYMRSTSRKLNEFLSQLHSLESINASDELRSKSTRISSIIDNEFQKCNVFIGKELSSIQGSCQKKAAILTSIHACQEFSFVAERLPSYAKLQHQVRILVSKEAQEIEGSIECSSEWDSIDSRIDFFESALVLDSFIDGEVTHRLTTIRRMRDQKEHQVEGLMQNMISERKFHQIGQFLSPLAKSKDQIKKQRFEAYQSEIAVSLEEIIYEVSRLLEPHSSPEEQAQVIAQKMDVLFSAESELQPLLVPRLDMRKQVLDLKKKSNTVLESFTDTVQSAIKSSDFVLMIISRRKANVFNQHMNEHLTAFSKRSLDSARQKTKNELQAVSTYVQEFFNSSFEKVNNLAKAMAGLKDSTEHQDKLFEALHNLYKTTKQDIEHRAREIMSEAVRITQNQQVYDDVIPIVHALNRNLQGPLKLHCSSSLLNECNQLVDTLRLEREEYDRWFEFDVEHHKQKIEEWSKRMDILEPMTWSWSGYISSKLSKGETYESCRVKLLRIVESQFHDGYDALKTRDVQRVQECLDVLECIAKFAKRHVSVVVRRLEDLRGACVKTFLNLCKQAEQILQSETPLQFEELFFDYQAFSITIPCVLQQEDGRKRFALINQLLFELFEHKIALLRQAASQEVIDFSILRLKVLDARAFGDFLADNLTLLHERTKDIFSEKWLDRISEFCFTHCSSGRDLGCIKYCALLGVSPSSSETDINKAFKEKARLHHPDKNPSNDGTMFRAIKEAHDKLLSMRHLTSRNLSRPFDDILIGIGEHLRRLSKKLMNAQQYELAEKLLFQLPNMKVIADLVTPALECDLIIENVYKTVKDIIEKARIEIDSFWKSRNYKELNGTISDLKLMEGHFSAYPQIFSSSWDAGITKKIETEIESLGEKGSLCLESHVMAKQKMNEFRRAFIEMGFVLVELPSFKAFTKRVMSDVLESCLDTEWGYGYLFEIGLSLQKGDDSCTDDENRVAQMLITEFSHFKEVQTMVWNEETTQKPAEDVVAGIKGEFREIPSLQSKPIVLPIDIDKTKLLESFKLYDQQYKSLLGDYLKPDADLNVLVHKTLALATRVKPSDASMDFGDELKKQIPVLLASVFALFTVLKSGASYNRIESAGGASDLGAKLLMKPHNIQVRSLLPHVIFC
jgi:energy-coupling factor transporter ATP-binding protein EcfA2